MGGLMSQMYKCVEELINKAGKYVPVCGMYFGSVVLCVFIFGLRGIDGIDLCTCIFLFPFVVLPSTPDRTKIRTSTTDDVLFEYNIYMLQDIILLISSKTCH